MSDIPGFFYDESKKKYFKILENKFSTESVLTKEMLAKEALETKRKKDLKDKQNLTCFSNFNIYSLIKNRQNKFCIDNQYQVYCKIISSMKLNSQTNLGYLNRNTCQKLTLKLLLNKTQNNLALLCKSERKNFIEIYDISNHFSSSIKKKFNKVTKNSRKLDIELISYPYEYNLNLVDLAFVKEDLVVTVGNGITFTDKATISFYSPQNEMASNFYVNHLLNCVSGNEGERVVVGTTEGAIVVESSFSGIQHYHHFNINAITPLNSNNPNESVMLMGLKNGKVMCCDLREHWKSAREFGKKRCKLGGYSVTNLQSLSSTNSYLCSFSNGQILNIDCRNRKVITEYFGHQNDYRSTPLSIDPSEIFLSSVGVDSYTRVWELRTGDLLNTIPPPIPTTTYSIPAVTFLPTKYTTVPGIFMLINDNLYTYSF